MLMRTRISPTAERLIATADGDLLALAVGDRATTLTGSKTLPKVDEVATPMMRKLWRERGADGELAAVRSIDGHDWVIHALRLDTTEHSGASLSLLMAAPRDELQAFQIESRRRGFYVSLALLLLMLPFVHLVADRISSPLRRLAREAEEIRHFNFDGEEPRRSKIREVDGLASAMTAMKHSLRRFLEISRSLSAERDFDVLLDRILKETAAVSGARSGSVHLLSADGLRLEPAASMLGGETATHTGIVWQVDNPSPTAAPVRALHAGDAVEVELRWSDPEHVATFAQLFEALGAARLHQLCLPLRNRQHEVIGTLTLSFVVADDQENAPRQR